MQPSRKALLAGVAVLALSLGAGPAFASASMCNDKAMGSDQAMSGDAMGHDNMAGDAMGSDNMASDNMASDSMGADNMAKTDAMGSADTMNKDAMGSDSMGSDNMAKSDSMSKDDAMSGDAMGSDAMGSDAMGSGGGAMAQTMDYTVKTGDSLWSIAADQLCDGERYTEIVAANKDALGDKMMVHPGQVLHIPGD